MEEIPIIDLGTTTDKELQQSLYVGLVSAKTQRKNIEEMVATYIGSSLIGRYTLRLWLRSLNGNQLALLRVTLDTLEG